MSRYEIHPQPPTGDADASILVRDAASASTAAAQLWWSHPPPLPGEIVGAIGGFTATDSTAAAAVLDAATARLAQAGCTIAIGPMDGNTWRTHRFVIESDGRGPFLLEPRNPAPFPDWWRAAGFSELSRYSSSIMPLDGKSTVTPALTSRLENAGVVLRPLDPSRYDDELRAIHAVSLASFSSNFLYTPLEESAFLDSYRKVREHVDPAFVRIAEKNGVPCGFVFGIPDLEAAARGETPALIVKTLAVDPASRCAGLGSLLVDAIHLSAWQKGYREAIHALQYENNRSLKITGRHHGHPFRRYALFHKKP